VERRAQGLDRDITGRRADCGGHSRFRHDPFYLKSNLWGGGGVHRFVTLLEKLPAAGRAEGDYFCFTIR
jgi:hypothetical protein